MTAAAAGSTPPSLEQAFALGAELGAGAFGVVRRATRRADGSPAAVKLAHPGVPLAEPERLTREARLLEGLEHPNLTRFLGLFRAEDGALALVYELVPGRPLDEALSGPPRPPGEGLPILAGIAAGLDRLHQAQLVHRDLKPENVMLTPEGVPKLLDFGLARPLTPGATLTATGVIAGTPATMAPELFEGRPATIRSDLFAFGCIAFQVLTGRVPYPGDLSAVLQAHRAPEPPRASAEAPRLPRAVDAPLAAALARDPARRPTTATDLVAALREALESPGPGPAHTVMVEDDPGPAATQLAPSHPLSPRVTSAAPQPPLQAPASRPPLLGALVFGLGLAALAIHLGTRASTSSATPEAPQAPATRPLPSGLPATLVEDYRAALLRLGETGVVDGKLVPGQAASGDPALREPLLWGELRRTLGAPLDALETWLARGGGSPELPDAVRETLRRADADLAGDEPASVGPPLYPHLDLHPAREPVAPPMESRIMKHWKATHPWASPELLEPVAGWRGTVHAALAETKRIERLWIAAYQRVAAGEQVTLEGRPLPGMDELDAVARIQFKTKSGSLADHYRDLFWTQSPNRFARLQYARAFLPQARAAHRVLAAAARVLETTPPEELDAVTELLLFQVHDLGEVATKSYLGTLLPTEVLFPVRDTPYWHLLAASHSDRVPVRRRQPPWRSPFEHSLRAEELAEGRVTSLALRYLIRERVIVEAVRHGPADQAAVRSRLLATFRTGAPAEWARYAPYALARLLRSHAEDTLASSWRHQDRIRLAAYHQAWSEHDYFLAERPDPDHVAALQQALADS